ncbi:hypothetical protein Y1Q_0003853 [Alligator mississippiensis]|uniref:Uncharacterized protein n=1 Tax=Alligator mississippiensis TaxID=8496 RepID=A0A151MNZ0_ALLMI|nr:hypothetical protein Y1Q_0003853 [Alligator mississippiensis]
MIILCVTDKTHVQNGPPYQRNQLVSVSLKCRSLKFSKNSCIKSEDKDSQLETTLKYGRIGQCSRGCTATKMGEDEHLIAFASCKLSHSETRRS